MFAVIFRSKPNVLGADGKPISAVRQTAVVPVNGTSHIFTRILTEHTAKRGLSGAWVDVTNSDLSSFVGESAEGKPVARPVTFSDQRQFAEEGKWTTLLQKLVRALEAVNDTAPNAKSATEMLSSLAHTAKVNPAGLVGYLSNGVQVAPSISVAPAEPNVNSPEPVVEPVAETVEVAEPAPLVVEVNPAVNEDIVPANYGSVPTRWAKIAKAEPLERPYIGREFDGITEDVIYDVASRTKRNILISGDAGNGKSVSIQHQAVRRDVPLVVIECGLSIGTDITEGRLMPDGKGGWFWLFSELATAIQQEGSIIQLNELSRTSPRNNILFMGLLQERRLKIPTLNLTIPVADGVIFVADMNIGASYTGAQDPDPALLDRFKTKLEFDDNPVIEAQLVPSPSLHEVVKSLRHLQKVEKKGVRTRTSTRMLINFASDVQDFNLAFAIRGFLNNYKDAEREIVEQYIQTHVTGIASDFGVELGSYADRLSYANDIEL
jgi:hypothetical protein